MNRTVLRTLLAAASTGVAGLAAVALWPKVRPGSPDVREWPPVAAPAEPGSEETFRVYVIGGSAAAGCPFESRFDFGRLVEWLYGGSIGGRKIVVRSHAGSGEDSLYALEDTRAILAQEDDPAHAALLVYSGNNEFVRVEPMQDLSKRERKLFDRPFVEGKQRAAILRTCEERLTEIVRTTRAAGMRVLVSTIAVNVGDWEPDRSVLADPAHEERMRGWIDAGEVQAVAGQREEALASFRAARELEPHFAWAAWRAGEVLRDLGRFAEARAAFQSAIDDNGGPNASTSAENSVLREIAAREGAALVDAESVVAAHTPHGLPGFDLFWDNCHPTTRGYLVIAEEFARVLGVLTGAAPRVAHPTVEQLERDFGFDDAFRARVWIGRGQYAYAASCLVWNPERRLRISHQMLEQAANILPDDPDLLCSRAVLALFEGRAGESRGFWRRAWKGDPAHARMRMKNRHVKGLLQRVDVHDGPKWIEEGQ